MRAVVFEQFGCAEVLNVAEITRPTPAENEVLIEVRSMAVNNHDLLRRQGYYDYKSKKRLGYDCCGVIVELGVGVNKLKKHDMVCAVLEGDGYAEYVAVHQALVVHVPVGIGWHECAALPYAGSALMVCLFKMNSIKAGETLLIHGGSGGVGSLAIQIAKYFELKVFVTVGSREKMNFCRELKADVCINYVSEKYWGRVLEETNGLGVNYILDCSDRDNKEDVQKDLECLARKGRLIFLGSQLRNVELDLQTVGDKRIELQGVHPRIFTKENREELLEMLEEKIWPAVESGKIRPSIFKVFALDEVQDAHRLMESKVHMGRIVLSTSHPKSV